MKVNKQNNSKDVDSGRQYVKIICFWNRVICMKENVDWNFKIQF